MCYTSGTTGNPKGVVYSHRSSYLHTMAICTSNGIGIGSGDSRVADRADVSCQRVGPAVRGADGRRGPGAARSASGRQVAGRDDREAATHRRRCGADDLERRHALPRKEPRSRRVVAAHGSLRRLGCPGVVDAHVRGKARRPDPPAVGHDRNVADGHHGLAAAGHARRTSTGRSARPRVSRCAASKPGSSPTTGRCCPTTTKPSARWKSAARGSPAPTTGGTTSPNSTPAGCAPATWAASTNTASSR